MNLVHFNFAKDLIALQLINNNWACINFAIAKSTYLICNNSKNRQQDKCSTIKIQNTLLPIFFGCIEISQ